MKSLLLVILFPFIAYTQWQPDVRLTNDAGSSSTSNNNSWSIAANGNIVHVVWYDNRDGNYEIYYKRSSDGGSSWGTDTRLTNNSSLSYNSSVSVSGSTVHIVWQDNRDGNHEIYFKRSTDEGLSWGTDTRLTNNSSISNNPVVSVAGSALHIAWYDNRDGNYEIYYKRSTDNGVSWVADLRLTNDTSSSSTSSISVSGSLIHVVWQDFRDSDDEIYYKRSTDGGVSWGADTRLTNNTGESLYPAVSVSGSAVNVVWRDDRDGNYEIYYKRSTDGGVSWGTDIRLTNNSSLSSLPSVIVSGSAGHVVWHDDRDGNYEIYYKRSSDGGVSWGTDTRLTNNSSFSGYPSISLSGSAVHVVWLDGRDGNDEIYYKRDPNGNVVGLTYMNSELPKEFKLEQNYPNPFNPSTNFEFRIAEFGFVHLTIYDVMGKEVETIVNGNLKPGTYKADWNASKFTSGVYFYKLTAGSFTETKKMLLVK